MGKSKQTKEKKLHRPVEISAPILDPEIIKAIHTPPRGLDLRHGGFKALLADLNSQDSTDEVSPLDDYHIPSYIGISCAVSGYTSFSSQTRRGRDSSNSGVASPKPNRSRPQSPVLLPPEHQVHHVTVDKSIVHSPDEERKELTEKLTASTNWRSPSPTIPPTESDRHHGAYVGTRYFPLSSPYTVNKHIPLLGIDDEADQDKVVEEENKVVQSIASLYGEDFVEDWRESVSHKAKREQPPPQINGHNDAFKSPKDLVTLKPTSGSTPEKKKADKEAGKPTVTSKAKNFLGRMFRSGDRKSPQPADKTDGPSGKVQTIESGKIITPHPSPIKEAKVTEKQPSHIGDEKQIESKANEVLENQTKSHQETVSGLSGSSGIQTSDGQIADHNKPDPLISSTPEPMQQQQQQQQQSEIRVKRDEGSTEKDDDTVQRMSDRASVSPGSNLHDGNYYIDLLNKEKNHIADLIVEAGSHLEENEQDLDEETIGKIRSAIGKANLLLNKKCKQFEELCDANINKADNDQFATLNDDLAGFWDMLSIQVNDVQKSFEAIWHTKDDSDSAKDDESPASSVKEKGAQSSKPKLSAQKDQERRERLHEHISQMKQANSSISNQNESPDLIGSESVYHHSHVEETREGRGNDQADTSYRRTSMERAHEESQDNCPTGDLLDF